MEKYLVLATLVGAVIALVFAFIMGRRVLSFDEGTPLMSKISRSIREGRQRISETAIYRCRCVFCLYDRGFVYYGGL